MTTTTILILLFAICCSSFVQRVGGFGFGICIMTVLPFIMPSYGEATTLSGLLAGVQSLFVATRMRRYLNWRRLLPILITFMIVSYFGVLFVSRINDHTLKHILGVILILVGIYFFLVSGKIHLKPTLPVQVSMGTISGLMGGFFAMQGPPAVLYFLGSENSREGYMANLQTYLLMGNIMMTIFRWKAGFLTAEVGIAWCCGLVAVALGTWLGTLVFNRLSATALRKVIYSYMIVSGIVALLS